MISERSQEAATWPVKQPQLNARRLAASLDRRPASSPPTRSIHLTKLFFTMGLSVSKLLSGLFGKKEMRECPPAPVIDGDRSEKALTLALANRDTDGTLFGCVLRVW